MKHFLPILFLTGLLFGQDTLRTVSGQVVIGKLMEQEEEYVFFKPDGAQQSQKIPIRLIKEIRLGNGEIIDFGNDFLTTNSEEVLKEKNIQTASGQEFNPSFIDSNKVKNNSITLVGASIGLATGSSMYLLSRIMTIDGSLSFPEFIVMMLGPSVINGIITPSFLESENKTHLRKGMFLSSCATTIMPLLGPMFGAPNDAPSTVATIIFMGTIGGAFWNHRLALFSPKYREALKTAKFKRRKQSADS